MYSHLSGDGEDFLIFLLFWIGWIFDIFSPSISIADRSQTIAETVSATLTIGAVRFVHDCSDCRRDYKRKENDRHLQFTLNVNLYKNAYFYIDVCNRQQSRRVR